MEIIDIAKIIRNGNNHRIWKALEQNDVADKVFNMLEKLDASQFKEINPNGKYDFTDIPLPVSYLPHGENVDKVKTTKIENQLKDKLDLINKEGSNLEYSAVLLADENGYCDYINASDAREKTACSWDSDIINEQLVKAKQEKKDVVLFHTHPAPLLTEFDTLYNKNKECLEKYGVKEDGLNISLADINVLCSLSDQVKGINTSIAILMHDGTFVEIKESDNGIIVENQQVFENVKVAKVEKVSLQELQEEKEKMGIKEPQIEMQGYTHTEVEKEEILEMKE